MFARQFASAKIGRAGMLLTRSEREERVGVQE
jgi:hypothetical protein